MQENLDNFPPAIQLAFEIMQELKERIKSSEDFFPRKDFPVIGLETLRAINQSPNKANILQHFMVHTLTNNAQKIMLDSIHSSSKRIHYITLNAVIPHYTGYGECGPLSCYLLMELMGKVECQSMALVPILDQNNPNKNNHMFISLTDEYRNHWALDPFLNVCCPKENYLQQEQVAAYLSSISNQANYSMDSPMISIQHTQQKSMLKGLKQQLNALRSDIENNEQLSLTLGNLLEPLALIPEMDHPEHLEQAWLWLKNYFVETLIHENQTRENATRIVEFSCDSKYSAQQLFSNSGFDALFLSQTDPHNIFVASLEETLPRTQKGFRPFWESIDQKNYGKALRGACTIKDYILAHKLVATFSLFRTSLNINMHEKNIHDLAPIDYAIQAGNDQLVTFLESIPNSDNQFSPS